MLPTRYASILKRFIAYLVDTLITVTIPLISFLILRFMTHGEFLDFAHGLLIRWPGVNDPMVTDLNWMFNIFVLINIVYFALFEGSRRQATPGKMMMGIFVADLAGGRISYLRAFGRSLGRILSLIICFMGYLVALFTARNQALHDLMTGTLVLEPDYMAARAGKTSEADREVEASIEDENSPAG